MWIPVLLIICITGVCICEGNEIINAVSDYKKKKLEEEHKTTNLALIYQILSTRPELSLEEVAAIVDRKGNSMKELDVKNTKHSEG